MAHQRMSSASPAEILHRNSSSSGQSSKPSQNWNQSPKPGARTFTHTLRAEIIAQVGNRFLAGERTEIM